MDINKLVSKVDGLNSVSTAKKWIILIKEISGHEFKKVHARNNRQFISFYNFTDDDVEDFRTIAFLKNEMSLKDAIRATYGDIQKRKEYSLAEQLKTIKEDFITLNDNFKNLHSNNKILQMKFQRLEKEQEEILSTLELLPFGAWEKARRKFGK
jgi:ATP-dependent Lon protease